MKIIAGAIFILAAAILFGAGLIAEAVRPSGAYTCPTVGGGGLLVLIGLGFIAAGVADRRAGSDDPLLTAALRRALKARTTPERKLPQGGPDVSVTPAPQQPPR